MKQFITNNAVQTETDIPEKTPTNQSTIKLMLKHLSAGDIDFYDRLLDTLAVMIQTGQKISTAIIFQGVDWRGARKFAEYILIPLFDLNNISFPNDHTAKNLKKSFERNYVIFYELAPYNLRRSSHKPKEIRRAIIANQQMNIAGKAVQSNATWFLYYDLPDKLQLDKQDDIFTVSPHIAQWIDDTDWWTTESKIRENISNELPGFIDSLENRQVNVDTLQHSLKNAVRQALIP